MDNKKRKSLDERVKRALEKAFPSPEPESHRYIVEKDRFSYYLYGSVPRQEGPGDRLKVPVAKLSYIETGRLWQLSWMPPEGRWKKYGRYFDLDTAILIIKADPISGFLGDISPSASLKKGRKKEAE